MQKLPEHIQTELNRMDAYLIKGLPKDGPEEYATLGQRLRECVMALELFLSDDRIKFPEDFDESG